MFSNILATEMRRDLTAMNVPGRNIIPRREIVFMAELSLLLSEAKILIAALSSLLAFAMMADVSAMLRFACAFFAAM